MNYRESLAWLEATRRFGIKLGLENARRLFASIGAPQKSLSFLHIAGTNGKGSTCAFLEEMLRSTGKRVGLYTSPHLVSFRERIRVNGENISEQQVAERLTKIREKAGDSTCFEIITALALDYFHAQQCDIIVWETGLGGRLDATNVVQPIACGITHVSLDHQAWLGHSLAEIAAEKAGIIKPGVPVVSAPQHPEAAKVLRQTAAQKNAPFMELPATLPPRKLALSGLHQQQNAELAWQILRVAKIAASEEALRKATWAGRFQAVGENIILDGAHNPAAAEALVATWRERFGEEKATLVFGGMKDKDMRLTWDILRPIVESVILTAGAGTRWMPVQHLCEIAQGVPAQRAASISEALDVAQKTGNRVLVTGSLFLVGEALSCLTNTPQDWVDA